jgi:hypothetical protein
VLVFDHISMPGAGTQVPAGGVKPGEGLEEAVLREVAEETGLLTVTVVRQIAVEDKPHPGGSTLLIWGPVGDHTVRAYPLGVKGSQVQILSSRPAFSQVIGRFLRDGKAAFSVFAGLVVAWWSHTFPGIGMPGVNWLLGRGSRAA